MAAVSFFDKSLAGTKKVSCILYPKISLTLVKNLYNLGKSSKYFLRMIDFERQVGYSVRVR